MDSFNTDLVTSATHLTLGEYIKEAARLHYPTVDISFAEDLAELCKRKDICVSHDMLVKYGIIGDKRLADVKRMLDQFELVNGEDYQCATLHIGNHGGKAPVNYKLTPEAFQLCLMRSKNERKYARYYILLLEMSTYYELYQQAVKQAGLIRSLRTRAEQAEYNSHEKDICISRLEKNIQKMREEHRENKDRINELIHYAEKQNVKQDVLFEKMEETHDDLIETRAELGQASKKLGVIYEERVVPTGAVKDSEAFIILSTSNDFEYRIIKGKVPYANKQIKNYVAANHEVVIHITGVPNSVNLFDRFKKKIGIVVKRIGNTSIYRFPNCSEQDVRNIAHQVNEEKYHIVV